MESLTAVSGLVDRPGHGSRKRALSPDPAAGSGSETVTATDEGWRGEAGGERPRALQEVKGARAKAGLQDPLSFSGVLADGEELTADSFRL